MIRSHMGSKPLKSEAGQAAALIALLLFFAFLPLASLAIDGGIVFLMRRDLQNVADASALSACRVLAQGGDYTSAELVNLATTAARNTIQTNLGAVDPFVAPQTGTGVTLIKGIEIAVPAVRVALQRPAPTVLTQFLGRGATLVTAQAHCNSTAGGGLLPVAVQRYDGAPGGTLRDYLGNKAASGLSTGTGSCERPVTVYDPPVPYPADSVTTTWAGRYGPWPVPLPQSGYAASDGDVDDSNTGPEVLLLGQNADTNNNASGMRNLVLLDIRNIASGTALEYYNGAYSQANAAKDMSQNWIYQHGYPGPYPQTGSQVAILDGASNAFAAGAMQDAGYRVGDAVAAVVYDGYVWATPNFKVVIDQPNNGIAATQPMSETMALVYSLRVVNTSPASAHWYSPLDITFHFDFTNKPAPAGTMMTIDGNLVTGDTYTQNGITEAGWTGTLRIWTSQLITPSLYLSGLNVYTESSLRTRGVSTNYGFGYGAAPADYALRNGANDGGNYPGKLTVRQNQGAQVIVTTFGAGTFPGGPCNGKVKDVPVRADVLVGGIAQDWSSYFTSSQTGKIDVEGGALKSLNLALTPRSDAFLGSYTLRITVGPGSCGGTTLAQHTMDIPLEILGPVPTATPDKFVYIQGYAVFRISCVDTNDIWGYAISPLYERYEDVRVGLRARLVPWD